MSDSPQTFQIQLPDGRQVGIQASSPEEAAQGARNILAREKGEAQGKEGGVLPYVDNLVRQAASGLTLGYADEIDAAFRHPLSALGGVSDSVLGTNFGDQAYSEELAKSRARDKAFHDQNPIASTAANIAGNVGISALALPAGATAIGPSLVGNAAKAAAIGGGMGAVQGFGEGEGGFANRVASGLTQGAFGAAGGAAAPVVGAAAHRVMETGPGRYISEHMIAPLAAQIDEALGNPQAMRSLSAAAPDDGRAFVPQTFAGRVADSARNVADTGAVTRLANATQRSGLSPDDIARQLDRLGPEAMLADVDPQFLSEARRANTLPGETRSFAKTVLESRDRQTGNRLVGAFEGNAPPPSSYDLSQGFDANLRAVGQRAYGEMEDAGLKQTPELMALYENPYVSQAIDHVMNVEKNSRVGRPEAVPASPVEIMHKVKQAIWNMGFDAQTARPGPNASYFRDLGVDYVNKLKSANPALADADRQYAQAASLPNFMEAGRNFLRKGGSEAATDSSAAGLSDLLSNATEQQALAARAGATNAARETALEGITPARALARRVDQSQLVRDKLTQLYGPDQADAIIRRAGAETTFADTSNEILRGSKTADKLAEALDTGNAALRITPEGVTPRIIQHIANLPEILMKPNEPVRNAIGRMTLNSNPEENRRILKLVDELMKRRSQGQNVRVALGSSLGTSIAGP